MQQADCWPSLYKTTFLSGAELAPLDRCPLLADIEAGPQVSFGRIQSDLGIQLDKVFNWMLFFEVLNWASNIKQFQPFGDKQAKEWICFSFAAGIDR